MAPAVALRPACSGLSLATGRGQPANYNRPLGLARGRPARLLPCTCVLKEERKSTGGKKGEGKTTSGRGGTGGSSGSAERGKTTGGRPGTGGSSGASERKTTSGRKDSTPRSAQRPPPGVLPPSKKTPPSKLDQYVRQHPVLSRFYDTTLLLGDAVMIAATEASSERIELADMPTLIGVMLIAWLAAAAYNGDYSGRPATSDNWYMSLLGPTFSAIVNATVTWAFAATASIAVYSYLVSHNALSSVPLVEGLNTEDLSPQLEVVVALLITMTCWRGIASKLRFP